MDSRDEYIHNYFESKKITDYNIFISQSITPVDIIYLGLNLECIETPWYNIAVTYAPKSRRVEVSHYKPSKLDIFSYTGHGQGYLYRNICLKMSQFTRITMTSSLNSFFLYSHNLR